MKFKRHVKRELREILMRDLKEYEKSIRMTKEERRALYEWVSEGNSPYDNGCYLYNEMGCPMDYITAERTAQEQLEHPENFACHYIDDEICFIPKNIDSDELPF